MRICMFAEPSILPLLLNGMFSFYTWRIHKSWQSYSVLFTSLTFEPSEQVQLVAHRTYRGLSLQIFPPVTSDSVITGNAVYSEDRHVQIYRYQYGLANPSQIAGLGFCMLNFPTSY
jgi:hypothetical protein